VSGITLGVELNTSPTKLQGLYLWIDVSYQRLITPPFSSILLSKWLRLQTAF